MTDVNDGCKREEERRKCRTDKKMENGGLDSFVQVKSPQANRRISRWRGEIDRVDLE